MSHLTSQTILGILGSGQLARMTAIAASELGINTHIYCSESEISPAQHIATQTIKGHSSDLESILDFCQNCDIITLENEFIEQNILNAIEEKFPNKLFPSAKTFSMIGDKLSEKEIFEKAGIKVVPFKKAASPQDVLSFADLHNYPVVLKSSKGGYDGYGNITINNASEVYEKFHLLKGELLVEAFIPYEKEVAIMIARNSNQEMIFYPIAHTIQENHICHFVNVPASISVAIEHEIKEAAKKAMISVNAIGIFAFEFFLTKDGQVFLNESAPRPHNSGHYSIEGCTTSQFHNHVRSVFNLPLGSSTLKSPVVMMLNLLGTNNGLAKLSPLKNFLEIPNGYLHLYGKKNSKIGRKMGHFTLLGENKIEMIKTLEQLKSAYTL